MSAYIENNTLSVLNPITKETIDSFSISSKEDINKAISNAANDKIWRNLSLSKRCYNINKLRKALVKNKDLIHETLKAETGKPDFDILIEIFTTLEHLKEISKIARKALKPSSLHSIKNLGLIFLW